MDQGDASAGKSALLFEMIAAHNPTQFDVSLIVETGDNGVYGMSVLIDYQTETIGRQHATNIAASFDYLLSQITRDPSMPLNQIGGISTLDTEQICDWNKVLTLPVEKCLHEVFIGKALETPSAEAISSWDGSMSYRQLHQLSTRLAKHLAQLGVGPETKVPLCFERSMWTIVAIISVLKAGGCFVLLDPAHPESRLWNIINEIEASVLICFPLTNKSKKLDTSTQRGDRQVTLLTLKPSYIKSFSPVNDETSIFTSGTTVTPKGVIVRHQAIVTGLSELGRAAGMLDMGAETRTLQFASYAFDASIGDIFCTLQVGGCGDLCGHHIVLCILLDPSSVPSLRFLCFSGEALSASRIEAWSGCVNIISMYGPTEATITCIAKSEVNKTTSASNIGRASRGTTWVVDEHNHGQLRAIGATGELLI
ncbi:hypothetical protein ACHAQI_012382 [Fusarium lateritium]